jgi:dynein heavy chain
MKVIFKSILKGFLELDGGSGLSTFADPIITQTVALYKQTMAEFLPTPLKCHYTFNLRDLSKVVQGMLMINLHNLAEKEDLVYLWIHEVFRVFRDRLIDQKDRDKFSGLAHEKLTEGLDLQWELSEYVQILFGDYESNQGEYNKLSDVATLIPRLENQLDMHNTEQSPMNLVFFSDCIQHLTRICRVLRQERGNVLLVGVGGSGRRSMARLAAYMNEQKTTSIEIIKGYKEKNFHEDIREMLRRAGVENEKLIFLFSDTQIVLESFLEDINNLINSGEIPRLFAPEDKQMICEEIGARAREAGQGDNRDQIYAYFVQVCRDNLHIVLAFSPVGDLFRNRCRQFPSITNCCTIDWYNPWPADALHAVAHREYSASQDALGISEHLDQLCLLSVEIHKSVSIATDAYLEELRRYNYTTPTSYLDLLKTYK